MLTHISSSNELRKQNTPSLHVVTVYYGKSDVNSLWLRLQQEFLKHTTKNYRFSVYLNDCDKSLFTDIDILGIAPNDIPKHNHSLNHLCCLKKLIKLIDQNSDTYLILDSDCFPIQQGWQSILLNAMDKSGHQVAAPIRVENLDLFPHPCAMFITNKGMKTLEMIPSNQHYYSANLLGVERQEPTCNHLAFPLLRSNQVNIHPIGAAIYHNIFYHHGAGSRQPTFHSIDKNTLVETLKWKLSLKYLDSDPWAYIAKLNGTV